MKKLLLFILALTFALVIVGCDDPVVPEEYTLSVEAEVTTLKVGETITIFAETNKPDATFEWSSSDEEIAKVNQVGMVTGVGVGTATITVKVEDVGEEEVEITVTEKDMTTDEAKDLLMTILDEYLESTSGSLKITTNDEIGSMVSELVYNYNNDGEIESLMYKLVVDNDPDSERHVYVKDGYSYILANKTKVKNELTAQEITSISTQYSQAAFLAEATKFYTEDAFYAALEFSGRGEGTVEFKLNLSKYEGEVFNTVGADEIKLVITLNNDKVTIVEIQKKVGSNTVSLVVEYKGSTTQTITYPSDLDSYEEQ